jgi:fumarate reductase flavoprotein subunit
MAVGVVISLIFLQLSCAGVKDRPAAEISPEVEETPEAALFLAGTHKSAGISCDDCHKTSPPTSDVSEAVCMTCHEDYKELTAGSYEDPHNAHIEFPSCGDCHHAHQASENQCLACHAFGGETP